MGRRKLTEEEKAERTKIQAEKREIDYKWKKIFRYVEKEVLGYDENQHIQKNSVLRLRGLQTGKVMANGKTENNGNYPLDVVMGAVYLSKDKHLAMKRYKQFDSESREVGYFCAIVRDQINSVYNAWKQKKHYEGVVESALKFKEEHWKGKKYKPKPYKPVTDSEELW